MGWLGIVSSFGLWAAELEGGYEITSYDLHEQ